MTQHTGSIFVFVACSAALACSAGADPNGPLTRANTGGGSGSGTEGAETSAGGASVGIADSGATPINIVVQGESCASAAYQSELLPASLLFVVDRSGSMNCNLPPLTLSADCETDPVAADPAQPTKWSVIVGAMSSVFDQLAAVPNASAGLTLFSNDDACGAQSIPNVGIGSLLPPQVNAIKNALQNASPLGGTPIIGATILGFEHLHEEAKAPGNRFLVLVTDGADSCVGRYPVAGDVETRLLETELPKALSVNIRTFVIGAPGSEPARGLLSKMAFAGGTASDPNCDHASDDPAPGAECHFDMTRSSDFAADLADALERISGRAALSCEFEVPRPADNTELDVNRVNVDYYRGGDRTNEESKVELFRDDTQGCESGAEGWQYTDENRKIRLCGAICDEVRADGEAEVIVSVGCEQRVVR